VCRFSDHWSARQPDPRVAAIAEALSWKDGPGSDNIYRIPETSLSSLMAHVSQRLELRGGMRTVGPPGMRVRTVLVSPGTTDLATTVARLKGADVVLAGEPREWEVVPYVLDARESGAAKALISIGRIVSEEPGMRACAAWIRTLAPGLRVEALPVSDPFWNAAS
jgi:NIF3 (NGG1p interacting factor 3)